MHSRMFILALAGLWLNAAVALPVDLDRFEQTIDSVDELLDLLSPESVEEETDSLELNRLRRQPIEDPDPVDHSHCGWHPHPDELEHERRGLKNARRERRAAGKDSSGTSEEEQDNKQPDKQDSSSSEEQVTTVQPARKRRAAGKDSSGSSEAKQDNKQPDKQDSSSSEEKATTVQPARKRRAADEHSEKEELEHDTADYEAKFNDRDSLEPMEENNSADYAQGCEVLEVSSKEANNETTYLE